MTTTIAKDSAMAIKKQSVALFRETNKKGYFARKFMGSPKMGEDSPYPVQVLKDLEKEKGEYMSFDLLMEKTQQPVEGDDVIKGKGTPLQFYTDGLYLNQMRGESDAGGAMTRKRTIHDLRDKARRNESTWWANVFDQMIFMYASGARGVNAGFQFPTTYTGFAGNTFAAPDSEHIFWAGKTSSTTIAATNKADLKDIDKLLAGAEMMNEIRGTAGTDGSYKTPMIRPVMVDGGEHYVMIFNPWQVHDLQVDAGTNGWMDIQKSAAAAEGSKNKIFTGTLGMYKDVVLHKHKNVIRFSTRGAGSDVETARALFLGAQAVVVAWGSPGGNGNMRFKWHEEFDDRGNVLAITTAAIIGVEKVTFNGKDFGVYCYETAAADPRT